MSATSNPHGVRPALAILSRERRYGPGRLYERKLDGERCVARCDGNRAILLSRSSRDVTDSFPEVADAVAAQPADDLLLDGEVVAVEGHRTSFARLQGRMQSHRPEPARESSVRIFYYVFDLLRHDGEDVTAVPLRDRKQLLRSAVRFADPIRYVPHRNQAHEDYFSRICHRGWEGLIVKRADDGYPSGRTSSWLKFKCEAGQELIIVGGTDPTGSRAGLGALLLGYNAGDDLVYAGKVGTGFSEQVLRDLADRLADLEVPTSPCTSGRLPSRGAHWARAELVAEVAFTEWTRADQLRHPRYLGLRRDKPARDVVREGQEMYR
ncbi:non-homologous end-joining DNA ligase [Microlunatus soli]|uniref:DNA ligase (ATP) n=1 Tax=Microlunatus soli TaxID=630515 RepID=A0A1H1NA92_9ACTN|nr:non-homologous end-joining DNA ligase [Microlunatus soli]SDR95867.1 bifunctional non-homologous end joining protein LigD [Microlunatus soli]